MKTFDYMRVESTQAIPTAAQSKFIAGGTNLLDLMKLQIETPTTLLDINQLPYKDISPTEEGGLRIGTLVTNSDLAAYPTVRQHYGVLARALLSGASGQLRNKASTGGNLLQRTRCPYFYALDSRCNKRLPDSGCDAKQGYNRMMAILGVSDNCIACHPSDMAVAMRALDATVETQTADGSKRAIPLSEFYVLPGNTPQIETVLQPHELITHITLPAPIAGKHHYYKVRDRASYAFALCSVAAVIDSEDNTIKNARLAFGGIGTMPWRNTAVEQLLINQPACKDSFYAAADLLLADAQGAGENDFKIPLTRRTLVAVLNHLVLGGTSA
jgi:xanthine dehydrogenase YagS FAD-binding subunit